MRTKVTLTVPEMVGFLKTIGTQSMFISMVTATILKRGKAIKTSTPYGDITKEATRTGWLNIKYNDAVRRKIAAKLGVDVSEVAYENGEVWHKAILTDDGKATPVRVNATKDDGKYYIFYFHRHTKNVRYLAANGDTLTHEQVKPYFYAKGKTPDFKPAVRSVTLNNVKVLKARGMILSGAH